MKSLTWCNRLIGTRQGVSIHTNKYNLHKNMEYMYYTKFNLEFLKFMPYQSVFNKNFFENDGHRYKLEQ